MIGKKSSELEQLFERVQVQTKNIHAVLEDFSIHSDTTAPALPDISLDLLDLLRRTTINTRAVEEFLSRPIIRDKKKRKREAEELTPEELEDEHKKEKVWIAEIEDDRESKRVWLDNEGVKLWNVAIQYENRTPIYRTEPDQKLTSWKKLGTSIRYFAWALMEAGTDGQPMPYFIYRNLHVASKTSVGLHSMGDLESGKSVLEKAALYHDKLKDPKIQIDGKSEREKAVVLMEFSLARVDIEMGKENSPYAFTMLKQAAAYKTEDFRLRDIYPLVLKAWRVGYRLLDSASPEHSVVGGTPTPSIVDGSAKSEQAQQALGWFQLGLRELEAYEVEGASVIDWREVKLALMEGLARSSVLASDGDPTQMDMAQNILSQLNEDLEFQGSEHAEKFMYLSIMVLQKRRRPVGEITAAFEKLIDRAATTEDSVNSLIGEISNLSNGSNSGLSGKLFLHLLEKMVQADRPNCAMLTHRILLALLLSMQKRYESDPDQSVAIVTRALDVIYNNTYTSFDTPQAMSSLAIIWKLADKLAGTDKAKSKTYGAQWFSLGAHAALKSCPTADVEKCLRRAALCYIENSAYQEAETILSRCSSEDASSYHLSFLLAARQNRPDQASYALSRMSSCPNLGTDHLLASIDVANEIQDARLLLQAMGILLKCLSQEKLRDHGVEELALVRCMIQLTARQLKEGTFQLEENTALLRYFRRGLEIAKTLQAADSLDVKYKEVAWLYKMAYNSSFQAMEAWQDRARLADMLEVSVELMELYKSIPGMEVDPQLPVQIANAKYFSICALVFHARETTDITEKRAIWEDIRTRLPEASQYIATASTSGNNTSLGKMRSGTQLYAFEALISLADWAESRTAAENWTEETVTIEVLDLFGQMIQDSNAPSDTKVTILRKVVLVAIQLCIRQDSPVYTLWIRVLIELLMYRQQTGDLDEALEWIKEAYACMDQGGKNYPEVQLEWLLATSYNRGLDFADLGDKPNAKKWLEMALALCGFARDGAIRKAQLYPKYEKILCRLKD